MQKHFDLYGKEIIMELKFYVCKTCGKIISIIKGTPVPTMCCGKPMEEIVAGSTDAAVEKHVPVYSVSDGKVTVDVGSVAHPMQEEHYIEWIAVQTKKGSQIKTLKPGDAPHAEFMLTADDEVEIVFAYCNLHGLWKA